jgi:hypothetical protein
VASLKIPIAAVDAADGFTGVKIAFRQMLDCDASFVSGKLWPI